MNDSKNGSVLPLICLFMLGRFEVQTSECVVIILCIKPRISRLCLECHLLKWHLWLEVRA